MESNLNIKSLFRYYLFKPRSDNLSSRDKKIATAVTILLGLCTVGVAHLFFRVFLYKDLSEKTRAQSVQTDQAFRQTISVKESSSIEWPPPGEAHLEPLHLFFKGEGKDCVGRTLVEMISWDESTKESKHDYIQWLFPTLRKSAYNSKAPIPSMVLVKEMRKDPQVIDNLRRAYASMLHFYGLSYDVNSKKVEPSSKEWFAQRTKAWCTPGNHNFARLDRMINSLILFGLQDEAEALYAQLERMVEGFPDLKLSCANHWSKSIETRNLTLLQLFEVNSKLE